MTCFSWVFTNVVDFSQDMSICFLSWSRKRVPFGQWISAVTWISWVLEDTALLSAAVSREDQDLSGGRCKRGRRTATLTAGGCPSCFPPFCSRTILYLWENRPACRDTELEIPCIPVLKLFWVIITQSESNLLSFWAYNRLIPPVTLEKRSILH